MGKAGAKIPNITISNPVLQPVSEPMIPVPVSQWEKYMRRLRNCGDSSQLYESLGWSLISLAGGAFLAALTFPQSVEFVKRLPSGSEQVNGWAYCTVITCWLITLFAGG